MSVGSRVTDGAPLSVAVRLWREHRALLGRWVARQRREPLAVLALIAQPMVWLALFGHLFTRMAKTAPVHRASIVTSRFIYLFMLTGAQSVVILVAAALMGARFTGGVAGLFACLLIGALFGAGVTSLSMALAFSLRSHAQFFPITAFVGLPLTFVSSALVPVSLMPGWMQVVAGLNPMTHAVDAVRTVLLDGWDWTVLGPATGTLLFFDASCLVVATPALRRGLR